MRHLNIKQLLKGSFLFIALFSLALGAMAQATAPAKPTTPAKPPVVAAKGPQSYLETFFKKYKVSPDSAIDYIFSTNELFRGHFAQINQLKAHLDSLQLNLGKYTGHELIIQKSASPSLVLYSYLVKHKNQPIRFSFIFYRAENEWTLYRFNFDDQMDTEMFEAAKISNKR
jgi:hypothetical protein